MRPLLNEAFRLLQRYAASKEQKECPKFALQAVINNQGDPVELDIEAFNKLVMELAEAPASLPSIEVENKMMLISVFAFKISREFNKFIAEFDDLMKQDSWR